MHNFLFCSNNVNLWMQIARTVAKENKQDGEIQQKKIEGVTCDSSTSLSRKIICVFLVVPEINAVI